MKNNQKELNPILLLAATAVVLILVVMVFLKSETNQELNQNGNDLNTASAELDNINIDSVDNELNQVNIDASTF